MEAFIQADQFNYIKEQARTIGQAKANSTDKGVVNAVREMSIERTMNLFDELTDEQKQVLIKMESIQDREDYESFLQYVKQFVIPFPLVSEKTVEKAFPKVKKLKQPDLNLVDLKETVYLRWEDLGTNRTYMLIPKENKLAGISGFLEPSAHKGICSICNGLEEVSLFTIEKKGKMRGTYSKKGNYICKDSAVCNHNLKSKDKLHDFLENLK
ncbi:FBP C-terminal treble-clef zinc-finger [Gracilibacillus ureilyticus]|uniref:FBP C-terminal treble-clef zinc-finger n=1 Tax=Gracilibacillus ureilyticus TaxID=531814 RepID=A0A1H9QN90_9BACI|nr:FusB/FusC family EF-G-binding protein [Gracilibacillus ureilyticus]SER62051.1 FBP C-terminal treble-clef zinc-finger [Gracilibacillus ureilyticus]